MTLRPLNPHIGCVGRSTRTRAYARTVLAVAFGVAIDSTLGWAIVAVAVTSVSAVLGVVDDISGASFDTNAGAAAGAGGAGEA